jgi:transcriptional regulator with XRE-family HTH domain
MIDDEVRAVRERVARTVRHLRTLRGISQETLAELIEKSSKLISEIERGKTNVGTDVLARIAGALSVDIVDLVAPPGRTSDDGGMWITADELRTFKRIVERSPRQRVKRKKT